MIKGRKKNESDKAHVPHLRTSSDAVVKNNQNKSEITQVHKSLFTRANGVMLFQPNL